MSNQYPTGYPPVPVSSGLMNSPHSYTGSPGPMSMNPGMQPMPAGMGPGMNTGMGPGMNPGMGPVMNPGMQPSMNPNMGPGMNPGMGPGMPPGMNPGMAPGGGGMGMGMGGMGGGMHPGMQPGMQGMPPGMPPGMGSGMQPGMGPGMSSVLSSALGGNIAPPLTSRMSPVIGPGMQHPMQAGMPGSMAGPMPGSMPQGMVTGMSPMQYSMGHPQASVSQGPPGMMQGSMPSNVAGGGPCDVNSNAVNNSGTVARLAPAPGGPDVTTTTTPSRDINTASLCRIGQETVQDIVSRTQEIFQTLKTIQPPNGTIAGANAANEKKLKVQEQLRTIRILFKRLRLIYEKCNDNSQLQGMEYTHIESLIPLKDEWDVKSEERKSSEAYRQATEEHKELIEAVGAKNKLLKDIIDHMRRIIWEINTMLMMRRS